MPTEERAQPFLYYKSFHVIVVILLIYRVGAGSDMANDLLSPKHASLYQPRQSLAGQSFP